MVKNLTTEEFKELVFDYTQNKEWLFKGKKPAIIDFFALWCNPCKTIAPILEELDMEYSEIDFYKVNTENENELAATFGIQSIPSILFIPLNAPPQMAMGALPKDTFIKAINEIILGKEKIIDDVPEGLVQPEQEETSIEQEIMEKPAPKRKTRKKPVEKKEK